MRKAKTSRFDVRCPDQCAADSAPPHGRLDCHVRHESLVFLSNVIGDVGEQQEEADGGLIELRDQFDGARSFATKGQEPLKGQSGSGVWNGPNSGHARRGARGPERGNKVIVLRLRPPHLDAHLVAVRATSRRTLRLRSAAFARD
jgi:hypothetical protein